MPQSNQQDSKPSAPNPRQVVTDAIREQEPKPTQLLALLSSQLSYGKIQDILSEFLELGTVELGSDRRLRMVLRERPVPDKAESVPSGEDTEDREFNDKCHLASGSRESVMSGRYTRTGESGITGNVGAWYETACYWRKRSEELEAQTAALAASNSLLLERITAAQWIPVEDRMPEADAWVLATDGDHWEVCNFHNGRAAKFWTAMHIHPITHWMPLPERPKNISEHKENQ